MIEKIQIELTTRCNLDCEYCLRPKTAVEIKREIFEELGGAAKKFILYGFGEPLMHKEIIPILNKLDGEIVISTNGMVDENFAEIAEIADFVGISVDLNAELRRGMGLEKVLSKLEKIKTKGIAEIVITRDNIGKLAKFAEFLAEKGVGIMLTNVIAPRKEIYARALYFEGSRINADYIHLSESEMLSMIRKKFFIAVETIETEFVEKKFPNLQALIEGKERIKRALEAEKEIEKVLEVAKSYGVDFVKPNFFGESERRKCPYERSLFVRSDSKVSPCMQMAYPHNEFVNQREKFVSEFTVGKVLDGIERIETKLAFFEKIREEMDFPWCGDCAHVFGCWFLANGMDCYGNIPSCSECLYSVGIAKCLV
ncbi:MAG: radical SAM protein [Archaeoglobaceae archaeon]